MKVCVRGYSLLRACLLVQDILCINLRIRNFLHLRFLNIINICSDDDDDDDDDDTYFLALQTIYRI